MEILPTSAFLYIITQPVNINPERKIFGPSIFQFSGCTYTIIHILYIHPLI